jgi:chromosome partitioning protein
MQKVEALEMPRGLAEANAPVLRSIVRNLTAIERVRPGHPAVDRDRVG